MGFRCGACRFFVYDKKVHAVREYRYLPYSHVLTIAAYVLPCWKTTTAVENEKVRVPTMVDTGKVVISCDGLVSWLCNMALEHHTLVVAGSFLLDSLQSTGTTSSFTTLRLKVCTQLSPIRHEYHQALHSVNRAT